METPKLAYPYEKALLVEGDLAVLDCRGMHLCGYCAFPDEDLPTDWRGNYDAPGLQFLAIHGGLTYASSDDGVSVFGFDCGHAGDNDNPALKDPQHVLGLAKQMREQLVIFREVNDKWLSADRQGRAAIMDDIRAQATLATEFGLGAMIDMLCGMPSLGKAGEGDDA